LDEAPCYNVFDPVTSIFLHPNNFLPQYVLTYHSSLNATISHPCNRLYHNSIYFILQIANGRRFQSKGYQSWYDNTSKKEYTHCLNTKYKGRYYLLKSDVYLSNKYTSMNSA
jgi:hypothetical protein